jgi:hypothetical protein
MLKAFDIIGDVFESLEIYELMELVLRNWGEA